MPGILRGEKAVGRTAIAWALLVGLAVFVVVASVGVPVSGQEEGIVMGRPEIQISATENRLTWGEGTLNVTVSNSGLITRGGPAQYTARVQTARNLRLEIAADQLDEDLEGVLSPESGLVLAGNVPPGASGPFPVRYELNESVEPGTYEIPFRLTYEYTPFVRYSQFDEPEYTERTETVVETVPVVVESRPRFELRAAAGQSVAAGDTGSYRVTITNTGTEAANDAVVTLRSANPSVFIGGENASGAVQSVFVPRLAPGETYETTVQVGALRRTPPGVYPLVATVQYEVANDVRETATGLAVGVAIGAEQRFAVDDVSSAVSAGGTGTVRGVVTNAGARPVRDAVVSATVAGPLRLRNGEHAVGTLAPGESAPFQFVVDAVDAEPGPVPLSIDVRYRNAQGDLRTANASDRTIRIAREQTFAIRNSTANVQVGSDGLVTGTLVNTGSVRVRNATVVFATNQTDLRVRNPEQTVGTLDPGGRAEFAMRLDVSNRTEGGLRRLPIRVRYRDARGDLVTSDVVEVPVSITPRPTLELREVAADLRVGESGVVSGQVVNTGASRLSNAVVVFRTADGTLQPHDTEYAVGTLDPGEAAPFDFRVDVSNRSDAGPRELSLAVRYRAPGSVDPSVSDALETTVLVGAEPTFALRNVSGSLRVGADGTIAGTVVNTGETAVSNAVVSLDPGTATIVPRERTFAVGPLEPGASEPFSFRVDVSNRSATGPQQVGFEVRYTVGDETRVSDDPLESRVAIAPKRDVFGVAPVDTAVGVDSDAVIVVNVTNRDTVPVRDVRVELVAAEPLSSDDSGAFIPRLAPGEHRLLRFALDADADSVPGTDSVTLQFTYTDSLGDRRTADPVLVPVRVVEREFSLVSAISVATVAVVLVLAGLWWRRRR